MINSSLKLAQVSQFSSDNVFYNGLGMEGIATAGQTTNIDLTLTDDCFITGGMINVINATSGDYFDIQIVDLSNIFGYGAGAVLRQFITNFYVRTDTQQQMNKELSYPSKIYAGLTIRIVYHSLGQTDVRVSGNCSLHKILF